MRQLLTILAFAASSACLADGTALLICDSKQVEDSWRWCFNDELGLKVNHVTSCYGCRLTLETGMSDDVQRVLSNKNIQQQNPDVVFIQLGCNDQADDEEQYLSYEKSLFDYPYGKVCTMAGANPRTKNIAISKDNAKITNGNFAGSLYRIVNFIRGEVPDARIFFLAPVQYGKEMTADEQTKVGQMKAVANMLCIPFADDISLVRQYDFIWKHIRPQLGKVLLIGDSYCFTKKWTSQFEALSQVDIVNLGKTSASLKEKGNGNTNTLGNQLSRIPSGYTPDIILIEGGINDDPDFDYVEKKYEEYVSTMKRTTFAGALAYIVKQLRGRFPKARIYAVTPGGLYYGHTDKPLDFIVKANQIRKVAAMIDIPTIDWDREGRLSFVFNNSKGTGDGSAAHPFHYNVPSRETGDLLHPNEIGGRYLAENVIKEIVKP